MSKYGFSSIRICLYMDKIGKKILGNTDMILVEMEKLRLFC